MKQTTVNHIFRTYVSNDIDGIISLLGIIGGLPRTECLLLFGCVKA
jgi:hypothetical protein